MPHPWKMDTMPPVIIGPKMTLRNLYNSVDWSGVDDIKPPSELEKEPDPEFKYRFRCRLLLSALPKEMYPESEKESWDKDRQLQARMQLKRIGVWDDVLKALVAADLIDKPQQEEDDGVQSRFKEGDK